MTEIDDRKTPVGLNAISLRKFTICGLTVAALIASVGYAVLIEKFGILYKLPLEFLEFPMSPSNAYMVRYKVAFREMLCGNYAIHFSVVGALLGLALGTVGAARNCMSAIAASIIGGGVGGAIFAATGGFLLGMIASFCFDINWETIRFIGFHVDPFVQTTLLQCAIWACVGIGIGLGCTLTTGSIARMVRGIRGGLIGGLLAGIVYSVLAAIFFSGSNSFDFVPKNLIERTVWATIGGLSICYGLVFSHANRSVQSEPSGSDR